MVALALYALAQRVSKKSVYSLSYSAVMNHGAAVAEAHRQHALKVAERAARQ